MRFIRKTPEVDLVKNELLLYDGWKRVKFEESKIKFLILTILFIIIPGAICFLWLRLISGLTWNEIGFTKDGVHIIVSIWWILFYFIFVFLHEFVHLLCIPNVFRSNCTYFGVSWYGGFAYSEEKMTRERYLFVSIMPCIVLSFVLPAILETFGILTTALKIMCIVNAMASGMDFLGCYEVLNVTGRKNLVVNNGENLYYINVNSYNSRRSI